MALNQNAAYMEAQRLIQKAKQSGQEVLLLTVPNLTALPQEIGQLTQLRSLDVSFNQLTALPPEIAQLTQLQSLNLTHNQLTALPPELAQLTELQSLDLRYNQLAALPPELALLTQLQSLHLDRNRLTALPPELAQLTQLQSLQLGRNRLTELPPVLAKLAQLQSLDLSSNKLTALAPEIAELTQLQALDLSDNQLTALPSEIAQLTQLQALDLSKNQLTALPPEIAQLAQLQSLNLSYNWLTAVTPKLAQLTQLQSLNLRYTGLTAVTPELARLTQLQSLNLGGNRLTALPLVLTQLTQLQSLDLDGNRLTTLAPEIARLTQLQSLDLGSNSLTALPPEIAQLTQLRSLDLRDNKLTTLAPVLARLTQLQSLNLSDNELTALAPEVAQLTQLRSLKLGDNRITALPSELAHLTQLETLNLGRNNLTVVPLVLADLTQLHSLDLGGNRITALPSEIAHLTKLQSLDLGGNSLTTVPPEIAQLTQLRVFDLRENPPLELPTEVIQDWLNPARILRHIEELHSGEERQALNEAKLLLVGEGNVGKTSLADRLLDFTRKADPTKTEGVDIRAWLLGLPGRSVRLNVWDFGGQEIYHATHQFFLTARSLYLLVIHARQGEKLSRLDYWLRMIESHGGDSPVIVILNQSDQHRLDLDRKGYSEKYRRTLTDGTQGSRIVAFVETACKGEILGNTGTDRTGFVRLRETIAAALADLPHVGDLLSARQFRIKGKLEDLEADHITHEEFCRMCDAEGLGGKAQKEDLARLFHDLGLALHYNDPRHPLVQDTNILNPEWVSEGIYRILSSPRLFTSKGLLRMDELGEVLRERPLVARSRQGFFARCLKHLNSLRTEDVYPASKHNFLVGMMEKFELCFPMDRGGGRSFLIPGLLGKEEPDTGFARGEGLRFEYHYPVLPESVMSRFIVRTYQHVSRHTYWRNGVVLATDGCRALVRADTEDCKVFIQIQGTDGAK